MSPKRIALLNNGSAGDVLPFVWLGRQLRERGHEVTIITSEAYEPVIRRFGLGFIPVGNQQDSERLRRDPRCWKWMAGTFLILNRCGQSASGYVRAIEQAGPLDLILAPMLAFGARLAREKLGVPLVSVHYTPVVMLSAYDPPLLLPVMHLLRHLPAWLNRCLYRLPNLMDWIALPRVREACRAHGVKPPRSLMHEWWNSPDGALALFPAFMVPPQKDWPTPCLQWSFPMEDLSSQVPMSAELLAFLENGEPPILFTPGSANIQAAAFFRAAAESVRRLGRRAIFITPANEQVPENLPPDVMVVNYVPYGPLLKHACAIVHHGGIGTLALALAAGVPQLIMPMAYDQPDNADRLVRLGVALSLPPRRFTADRVTAALRRLLEEPSFREKAARYADEMTRRPSVDSLVEWIEQRMAAKP